MKKRSLAVFTLLFIFVLNSFAMNSVAFPIEVSDEKLEPSGISGLSEDSKMIIYVYEKLSEDDMLDIATYAAADENAEIWLYPLRGKTAKMKIEANNECSKKLFGEYLGSDTAAYKEEDILQEACDKLNSSSASKKIICVEIDVNVDGEPQRAKYHLDYLEEMRINNPDIHYMFETGYMINEDVHKEFLFRVEPLGYEQIGNYTASYEREKGTVTIEKGKADKNILVVAESSKAELLHIGGYLATTETIQKYASKSKVKGVSLAYNKMDISRSTSPKNIAIALFTINDEVGSTASDEFRFMVKNAESVAVYTKSTPGGGTSGAKVSYNQTKDNEVENLYAPEPTPQEKEEDKSIFSSENRTFSIDAGSPAYKKSSGFFDTVKNIISGIFSIIFKLIKIALLILAALLIFHKKFRGNFFAWLFSTKYGPKIQTIYEKISDFIASFFVAGKKLKGNASLQGKFAFISHASIDMRKQGSPVAALVAELESMGVACWTAEKGIEAGEDYNEILPVAIKKCEMMLFFVSPVSINSEEVESEIIAAKREKKKLVPIKINDFDLFANEKWQHLLSQYQVADLFTSNPEEVKKMAEKIKKVFDAK
jgi:hypothetical protein